ncbi:hypothetical protein OBBRIDRAFT_838957 [Obba rivulosa]|uniref:Carbohydrate kinase FGGY C-terminal domain-containing protein n=1 Tax=Obba rivulosa TaxID=1052685 RepID=A0A8E2DF05_9APHY|nr:hypothetical protein OBBRIDRAFT_838957 [Obba rivulosa]
MSKTPEYLSLAHTVPPLTSSHADTPAILALAVIPACDTPSLEDFRPYKDAVFPDWWMNEGGQSSTGQLIDFIVTIHPIPLSISLSHSESDTSRGHQPQCHCSRSPLALMRSFCPHAHTTSTSGFRRLQELAEERGISIHEVLHDELERLSAERHADSWTELLKDMHFYPDLHGDSHSMPIPEAITLQTLHIIDMMNTAGHAMRTLQLSGGQAKNQPLVQLLANTCRMPVVLPASSGADVVLGAAMLGRFAHEAHDAGG